MLAAVVTAAGISLIQVRSLRRLWGRRKTEFAVAAVTAASVIAIGVLPGIPVAVAFAIVNVLRRLARPHDGLLGEVPGHAGYHTVDRWPHARTRPGVVVFRFDAPLFFANAGRFAARVSEVLRAADPPARALVLDAAGITDVDTTAADVLEDLLDELDAKGVVVAVADSVGQVEDQLRAYGLLGRVRLFTTVGEAVDGLDGAGTPRG